MKRLIPLLLALLAAIPANAATEDLSKVAASLEKNRSAVKKVSRSIDELKARRDELRRQLRESSRALDEVTAGWQALEHETAVQEANLEETERISGALRHQALRLACGRGITPTVRALLAKSLGGSSRAASRLREGWTGKVGLREATGVERQRLLDGIGSVREELDEIEEELRTQSQTREKLRREGSSLRKVFADLSAAKESAKGSGLGRLLPWPIDGSAAKASGELPGIVIRPRGPGAVRAVAGGEVVFSNPLPGLGTVVILQHGDYFTVYGNLVSSALSAPTPVKAGDALGAVEKGLDAQNGGLYFEVRHHDRALDPLEWLALAPGRGETPR